jgi:hypothetical protein
MFVLRNILKITIFGPKYDPPSYETLKIGGVGKNKHGMEERVKSIGQSWAIIKCTLVINVGSIINLMLDTPTTLRGGVNQCRALFTLLSKI